MIALKIALRFIRKSLFRTFVIVAAVVISVGVQFFISSLGNILTNMILEQATTYQEHILIRSETQRSFDDVNFELRDSIVGNIDDVNYAMYTSQVTGSIKNDNLLPITFTFFLSDNLNGENDLHNFYGIGHEQNIVTGRANDPTKNEIMLDDFFARRNNIKVGDELTFTTSNGLHSIDIIVVGTFDVGVFKLTRNHSYITYEQYNSDVFGRHTLVIQVENPSEIANTTNEIAKLVSDDPLNYYVVDWRESHPEIELLDLAQKAVVLVIQIMIAIAVFVVILSILSFSIQQKTQQVGILKAMGLSDAKVTNIFILMTTILSTIGAIIGLIGGTIAMNLYHNYMVYADGTHRFTYKLNFLNYFISFILVFIAVIAATIIAVRRIKKNKIIDLIKT